MANKKITDLTLRSDFDATCLMPADDPVQTWRVSGAQILSFVQDKIKSSIVSKSSGYTLTESDSTILANATSAGFTLELPAAAGVSGKIYRIKRVDNTPDNAVTLDPNGDELIDGAATRALYTQYESVTIQSDGSNWVVLDHKCDTDWEAYTPTYTGFGTVSFSGMVWRRVGDSMEIQGKLTAGTSTATEARMSLAASAVASGSPKIASSIQACGDATRGLASSTAWDYKALIEPSVSYITFGRQSGSESPLSKALASDIISSGQHMSVVATIPITGWWA